MTNPATRSFRRAPKERRRARAGFWRYTCEAILRDTLEDKLDFEPGSRYAYSNVGYCILGRVIERRSGMAYELFVRQRILEPSGATGIQLGRTLDPLPAEVRYYEYVGARSSSRSPVSASSRKWRVPMIEAMDALGQWVGSSIDFLRFMVAIDGQRTPALLQPETVRIMRARPAIPGEEKAAIFYGLGVQVRPTQTGDKRWHAGGPRRV